jgi:hypothetical protein
MAETEPKAVVIHPQQEDIFTTGEAKIQQMADRGELLCPRCGETLAAEKVVCEVYEGVVLTCLTGCNWREL